MSRPAMPPAPAVALALPTDGPLLPAGTVRYSDVPPAALVHWTEVVNILSGVPGLPAALIGVATVPGPDGSLDTVYQTVSPGWRVEPTWPVIVRHHDNAMAGPFPRTVALRRYVEILTAAGLDCALRGPSLYPTHLVVTGRVLRRGGGR